MPCGALARLIPRVVQDVDVAPLCAYGEDLVGEAEAGDPIALGCDAANIPTEALVFEVRLAIVVTRHRMRIMRIIADPDPEG